MADYSFPIFVGVVVLAYAMKQFPSLAGRMGVNGAVTNHRRIWLLILSLATLAVAVFFPEFVLKAWSHSPLGDRLESKYGENFSRWLWVPVLLAGFHLISNSWNVASGAAVTTIVLLILIHPKTETEVVKSTAVAAQLPAPITTPLPQREPAPVEKLLGESAYTSKKIGKFKPISLPPGEKLVVITNFEGSCLSQTVTDGTGKLVVWTRDSFDGTFVQAAVDKGLNYTPGHKGAPWQIAYGAVGGSPLTLSIERRAGGNSCL